jgi:glucose/arabinose dehydrogenase
MEMIELQVSAKKGGNGRRPRGHRILRNLAARVLPAAVLIAATCPAAMTTASAAANQGAHQSASGGKQAILRKIATFNDPTYVTGAPGFPRLLFVSDRGGRVAVVRDGHKLSRPFLDISHRVREATIEQGLLGLAFPPDYAQSGHFYVQYTDQNDDLQIDEYTRRNSTFAPASSRRSVLNAPEPAGYTNHNGGQLEFRGKLLYSGIGDGMDPGDLFNFAQSLDSLRGKIIRIDPRPSAGGKPYRIPRTNPFVGRPGRDEIFSYGLRNPFRFSFQPMAKGPDRMLISDVGEHRFEEIDYETMPWAWGGNFGWDAFEGDEPYDCGELLCPNGDTPDPGGTLKPVLTYTHGPRCAVIGGYVVRDPALPALRGRYLYSDYCGGRIRSFVPRLSGATDDHSLGLRIPPGPVGSLLTSFGTDTRDHIYVATTNGPVYELVPPRRQRSSR